MFNHLKSLPNLVGLGTFLIEQVFTVTHQSIGRKLLFSSISI